MNVMNTANFANQNYKIHRSSASSLAECMIYITLICNALILFGNPFQLDGVVSLATRVLLLSVLFIGAYFVIDSLMHPVDTWMTLFICVLILPCLMGLVHGFGAFVGHLVNIICFFMLPIYMISGRFIRNVAWVKNAIYVFNVIYALIFIFLCFKGYAYVRREEYGQVMSYDVALGYRNPNEAGMYLLVSFMIMVISFFSARNILYKAGTGFLSVILAMLIFMTNSRACILLAVFFVLMVIFRLYKLVGELSRIVILLLPLLSAVVIMIFPDFFSQWVVMGETADTGRYGLYLGAISSMNPLAFFSGNISLIGENLHNSYISIFVEYGIIVFGFYFALLSKTISKYAERIVSKGSYLAYIGVLAIVLHGIVEGTFLISGTVFAGLAGLLFVLMIEETEKV